MIQNEECGIKEVFLKTLTVHLRFDILKLAIRAETGDNKVGKENLVRNIQVRGIDLDGTFCGEDDLPGNARCSLDGCSLSDLVSGEELPADESLSLYHIKEADEK